MCARKRLRLIAFLMMVFGAGNGVGENFELTPIPMPKREQNPAHPFAAPEAEKIFRRDPRWLGGDAAITIALDNQRTLWLFGDSFIATSDKHRRTESELIRNSVALQFGRELSEAEIQFFWREARNAPSLPGSFFNAPKPYWFWPGHGVRLKEGPLVLFLFNMLDTPGSDLGFRAVGYSVAIVANPGHDPKAWNFHIVQGQTPNFDALPATAVIRQGDYLIALAIRQTGTHKGYLVRFQVSNLISGQTPAAEWWLGDTLGWVEQTALAGQQPQQILDDAGSECSIHWDAINNRFIHIATKGFGRSAIVLRTSAKITGPWSSARVVYQPPESANEGAFVYAAKAHPALSVKGQNGLLISYASSSLQFEALLTQHGQKHLYWPRIAVVAIEPDIKPADTP